MTQQQICLSATRLNSIRGLHSSIFPGLTRHGVATFRPCPARPGQWVLLFSSVRLVVIKARPVLVADSQRDVLPCLVGRDQPNSRFHGEGFPQTSPSVKKMCISVKFCDL